MPSPFRRFVQVGRVALINYGPDEGKLAVIVEVIDANRVLVDGPLSEVRRHSLTTKRISLTDIVIPIPHGARAKTVKKAYKTADVQGQWEKTAWAKKRAVRVRKANLSDFDRFKVMLARKKNSAVVGTAYRRIVKADRKKAAKDQKKQRADVEKNKEKFEYEEYKIKEKDQQYTKKQQRRQQELDELEEKEKSKNNRHKEYEKEIEGKKKHSKPVPAKPPFKFYHEKHADLTFEEAKEQWANLPEDQKQSFKDSAAQDKERYKTENEEFKKVQEELDRKKAAGGGDRQKRGRT